jgi:acetolactate synthase-1/2/3 large subunit
MAGFDDADVVIAIGYDLVEHAPSHWNPRRDKKIVVIDSEPAEIDEYFTPEVELVGDIYHVLTRLAEECRDVPHSGGSPALRDVVLGRFDGRARRRRFPMQPPRALWRSAGARARGHPDLGRGAAQAVDRPHVPRHEPNTVLIANGLAGMGFAVPVRGRGQARAPRPQGRDRQRRRRLPHELPGARDGDAPEDAVRQRRLGEPQYGSIVWKQDKKFGEHFGVDFTNPDFVKLAEAFGMPAWRCEAVEDFGATCATRSRSTCRR